MCDKKILESQKKVADVALGEQKADLVLKNARYLNVFSNEFCFGDIAVADGKIVGIGEYSGENEIDASQRTVLPGFIDSHIHLESAMVEPSEFARAVIAHGTTAVVVDPHEIANVMGKDGIDYMMQATRGLPIDVFFMIPSCVPATEIDESGASLEYRDIEPYYGRENVLGLAEMMNYVGVVGKSAEVLKKLSSAQQSGKLIDGHAPDLSGKALNAYVALGVQSDHECSSLDEALSKLRLGQYIMIREGTAAKNLEALAPLLCEKYGSRCMFATDDKHPSDLLFGGHIDYIARKAISLGADPVCALKAGTFNATQYFGLQRRGAIGLGYVADMVVVDNEFDLNVELTIKNGRVVFDGTPIEIAPAEVDSRLASKSRSTFNLDKVTADSFASDEPLALIGLVGGELLTENLGLANGIDVDGDILKIACVERHSHTNHIGIGYVKGYSMKSGAVATSVAHDSHNIIAVGCTDSDIALAVNTIRDNGGGVAVVENGRVVNLLRLPIAGLMSDEPLEDVNERLELAKASAFALGADKSIDPFMTLSFLSLPVIPKLRITTRGVFDVEKWSLC